MSDKPIRKVITNNSRALRDVQAYHQSIEKLILDGYRIVKNTRMDDYCRAWPQGRVVMHLEGHDPQDLKKAEEKVEVKKEEAPSEEVVKEEQVQVEESQEEAVSEEEPKKAPAKRGRKAKKK